MGILDRLKRLLGNSVERLEEDLATRKREERATAGRGPIEDIAGPTDSEQSALERARESIRETEILAGGEAKPPKPG